MEVGSDCLALCWQGDGRVAGEALAGIFPGRLRGTSGEAGPCVENSGLTGCVSSACGPLTRVRPVPGMGSRCTGEQGPSTPALGELLVHCGNQTPEEVIVSGEVQSGR